MLRRGPIALVVLLAGCATTASDNTVEPATTVFVGEAVILDDAGELPLEVSVTNVELGTPVSNEGLPDGRFWVVSATYRNLGAIAYVDRLRESVSLIGDDRGRYTPVRDHAVECDWRLPPLGGEPVPHVTVHPDDRDHGCVVFDVPAKVEPWFVDLAHDSGELGRWTVRSP